MTCRIKILETNPIVLPNHSTLFREPRRKYEDMTPNFLTRYDGHTIAVDVFQADEMLRFIGPPLFNLKAQALSASLKFDYRPIETFDWYDLSRVSRFTAPTTGAVERVDLEFGPEVFSVRPGADFLSVFDGKNVLITMNKNNKLENIRDWALNFVKNHGINSIIIYDNRSDFYSLEEIGEAVESISGLQTIYVVDWPYKFGNTGGPKQIWDSDFGIYMCWEHARWRFLQRANAVFISDVDEYPVSERNITLVEHVEASTHGALNYPVRNTPSVPRDSLSPKRVRLHSDYIFADKRFGLFSKKVGYQPKRIPEEIQVGNHSFYGMEKKTDYTEDVIARHFRGIHYSWREGNWEYSHMDRQFDEKTDFEDLTLLRSLKSTFPERFL